MGEKLLVDALRRAPEREFAQRREIARREIVVQRPLRLGRDIDLALLQALDQIVRRDVDDLDVVGLVEDRIRHGFTYAHPGDAGHHVVQAFDVLDVDGGEDVDAGGEQFLHVEPAFRVAAAGRVGVGEFVDQDEVRPAGEDGVEVHLLELMPGMADLLARHDLETFKERLRFRAPVGLDNADYDILAVLLTLLGVEQHLIGFAHAGRSAEQNLQPPARPLGVP